MTLSRLLLILVVLSSTIALGCSSPLATWGAPEIYIPPGSVAEIRGPHIIQVWVHGKDGKVTKGYVRAYDRYLIGPAAPPPPVTPTPKTAAPDVPAPTPLLEAEVRL